MTSNRESCYRCVMALEPSDIEAIKALLKTQRGELKVDFDSLFFRVSSRLDSLESGLKVQSEKLDRFIEYTERQNDKMHARIDELHQDVRDMADNIDAYAKQMETAEQERLVLGKQVDELAGRVTSLESAA